MSIKNQIENLCRNCISLEITGNTLSKVGETRFGGKPDVPNDFEWPYFEGKDFKGVVKKRPLSFLAQFNCKELSVHDIDHLLPDYGLLSFFYETDTQPWGFDPKDKGCARVFWFKDTSSLHAEEFPVDMEQDFKFPSIKIQTSHQFSYPSLIDLYGIFPEEKEETFISALNELTGKDPYEEMNGSQLLGWADVIQDSMYEECDLVSQGYYIGDGIAYNKIPKDILQQSKDTSIERWSLLFQLDTVEHEGFELMFGDSGHIYFYIKKEDLSQRNFDQIWLILQCY